MGSLGQSPSSPDANLPDPHASEAWSRKLVRSAALAGGVALAVGAQSVLVGAAFLYACFASLTGGPRGVADPTRDRD